jgi:hypothetical protein
MKRINFVFAITWKIIFTAVFVLSVIEIVSAISGMGLPISKTETDMDNYFDPSLSKINSVKKLTQYADSVWGSVTIGDKYDSASFPEILSGIVRNRFRHGYPTSYEIGNNFIAKLMAKISGRSYDAVVIGNDILKFSHADCRQQCLVMMEVLRSKNYSVRGISLQAQNYNTEHYIFEAFYDSSWHFYDPDLEPSSKLLWQMNRPSIAMLAKDSSLTKLIYKDSWQNASLVVDLFRKYNYGNINAPIPKWLYFFHNISKALSLTAWMFCLALYFVFRRSTSRHLI